MTAAPEIDILIEIPQIYDGYSVIVYKDGTFVNRWASYVEAEPDNALFKRRFEETEKAIKLWKDAK